MKTIFAKRLNELMLAKGVTQKDIAIATELSEGAISLYLSGRRSPREKVARKIANYFGVSYASMVDDENNYNVKIPVLGDVAGGVAIDSIQDINEYEEISVALAKTGEFFGLKIRGKSMEPVIHDGDIVIVRKQPCVENGEIAVVYMNDYRSTCKLVFHLNNGGIRLVGYNEKAYSPKEFTVDELKEQDFQILGKVIKSVHNF